MNGVSAVITSQALLGLRIPVLPPGSGSLGVEPFHMFYDIQLLIDWALPERNDRPGRDDR